MKILIKEDAVKILKRDFPLHMGFTKVEKDYYDSIREIQGKEIEVDEKYEFENSYNGIHPKGFLIHISKKIVKEV